ncbi:unnamed protein product [Leptidea sinapis]|uniref:EF-hand domain-containing protein n=1 Tax=Leptidea sinapis TaxID=189913 RepID=A0A5E4Q0S9_9NEOP|nr:unnamed protein product [Leptidea sinapis]
MHDTIVRLADVWKTCNKIRAAAFRVGLNLWEFYRPLDPEGNSLISESKFVSVLAGPLRAVVGLTDAEIAQLADYFRAQDGRVLYHQLCQVIHGEVQAKVTYTDAGGREQTSAECLLEACPPPPEPRCHSLDQWQLRRLCCLLATIAQRDIPLKPYFQDYELNDGRITFAHFARILNYIGVLVSPEDFNLLVRRFIKDSYTLDYVEFLKAVEAVKKEGIQGLGPEYMNPAAVIDTTLPKLVRPEEDAGRSTAPLGPSEVFHPMLAQPKPSRHLLELMLRVQHAIMSDREMVCVTQHYLDPNQPDRVCWRTFEDDCDQDTTMGTCRDRKYVECWRGWVYCPHRSRCGPWRPDTWTTLEDQPAESATISAPSRALRTPPPAHTDPTQTDIVQILAKIKGKMVREGVRPRDFLKQFDPRRELVIPRADFYRGLGSAGLALTPLEMDTLMEVFCAPGRRRLVEYERFCNAVGEAFTQGSLERAPLLEPVPHVPTIHSPLNFLNFEERHIASGALTKLAKFPDLITNILEVFKVNYRAFCNALDLLHATSVGQPC